jgi:hypothetical protein
MGTIDENALENLSLIVNLSKQLQLKSKGSTEEDEKDVPKYFPRFLWIVRDFTLRLLDHQGNSITSKEYFENSLKLQKGTSDNAEKKNRIRRMIKHFFQDRDCFTMVRPTEEEHDLQRLQEMDTDSIRPEFVAQMNELRRKIYLKVKPKEINKQLVTGEMLLELCHAYTEAINKGNVPCIESAWTYVCQNECQRAMELAVKEYESQLDMFIKDKVPPFEQLKKQHKLLKVNAIKAFKAKSLGENNAGYEDKINLAIADRFTHIKLVAEAGYRK